MKKSYLQKQALFPAFIKTAPHPNLRLVVVIPAYDEPDLSKTLNALLVCKLPPCAVEILIVINHAEQADDDLRLRSRDLFQATQQWTQQYNKPKRSFHVIYVSDLPKKKAGVGLARKIGLDEGVRRLLQASGKIDDSNGILVCFDADSICREDYLMQIYQYFRAHPRMDALSIGYAHPLAGEEFPDAIYQHIAAYELHLRYFLQAKKMAGCPHAIETIGSAMAVRQWAYQQQGGMNQRKAGEDFYFLHKFIATGRTGELPEPLVIPSPRVSHRVPFGTGRAVGDLLQSEQELTTYAPAIFNDLKVFIDLIDQMYTLSAAEVEPFTEQLPEAIRAFIKTQCFPKHLIEIQENTKNLPGFRKRFFRWLDAFVVMKYAHFARDHYYPNVPVQEAAAALLRTYRPDLTVREDDVKALLQVYRTMAFTRPL